MSGTRESRLATRVSRLGLVLLIGLWWTDFPAGTVVTASECPNNVCETEDGENADNCSEDCDPICGNNACESAESCQGCPEDCYEQCVCGDSNCNWPAEAGGYPWESCEEANWYFPDTECSYCPTDCGACDNDFCAQWEGLACQGDSGQCGPCSYSDECATGYQCVDQECVEVP